MPNNKFLSTVIYIYLLFSFIRGTAAFGTEIKNPGPNAVTLSPASKSFSFAKSQREQCMLQAYSLAAQRLSPQQYLWYSKMITNTCNCIANTMGNIWLQYERNDMAAGLAMQGKGNQLVQQCYSKYLIPFVSE